jgi:hypothetical protein
VYDHVEVAPHDGTIARRKRRHSTAAAAAGKPAYSLLTNSADD